MGRASWRVLGTALLVSALLGVSAGAVYVAAVGDFSAPAATGAVLPAPGEQAAPPTAVAAAQSRATGGAGPEAVRAPGGPAKAKRAKAKAVKESKEPKAAKTAKPAKEPKEKRAKPDKDKGK